MRRALSFAVLALAHTTSDKALCLGSGYVRLVTTFVKIDKMSSTVNKKLGTVAIGGASLI